MQVNVRAQADSCSVIHFWPPQAKLFRLQNPLRLSTFRSGQCRLLFPGLIAALRSDDLPLEHSNKRLLQEQESKPFDLGFRPNIARWVQTGPIHVPFSYEGVGVVAEEETRGDSSCPRNETWL